MPPRSKGRNPVSKKQPTTPNVSYWCDCIQCKDSVHIAPRSGAPSGLWLTELQFKNHKRDKQQTDIAMQHLASMSVHCASTFVRNPAADTIGHCELPTASTADTPSYRAEPQISNANTEPLTGVQNPKKGLAPSTSNELLENSQKLDDIRQLLGVLTSPAFLETLKTYPFVYAVKPGQQPKHLLVDAPRSAGIYELDHCHAANYQVLRLENQFADAIKFLLRELNTPSLEDAHREEVQRLVYLVKKEQDRATLLRRDCWIRQRQIAEREGYRAIDTSRHFSSLLRSMEPTTCIVYLLAATLHFLSNLSINGTGFLLPMVGLALRIAMKDSTNPELVNIPPSIPSDVRPIVTTLQIDPVFNSMVCCPSCFQTYSFNPTDPSSYPERCTFRSTTQAEECGSRLQVRKDGEIIPIRTFAYQDIAHWIGSLYSRPELERYLDGPPRRYTIAGSSEMEDIWDGNILRNFQGPDGQNFINKPNSDNEGRLIFGLNMDGFNPYHNREGGKHVSICGIYVVCYNLPRDIRYKSENIFLLGIVPGPREPSTYQVNHVLRPLVDDLLKLWFVGIYLTQTSKYPLGRPVRGALVPVICDLPAARRVGGLGGHSSGNFCSECLLQLVDINQLDQSKWVPRTYAEHYAHAVQWRDAATEAERTASFQAYGARWSELLRLPYWDPTKFIVIDQMHGFYLRLFQRHIRDVWGMDVNYQDGDGVPELILTEEEISKAQHALRFGTESQLNGLRRSQMQYLCRDAGLHFGGRKAALYKSLVKHRNNQGWPSPDVIISATGNSEAVEMNNENVCTPVPTQVQGGNTIRLVTPPQPDFLSASPPSRLENVNEPNITSPINVFDTEPTLKVLYEGTKTSLKKANSEDLITILILKLGGTRMDYASFYKKDLLQKIFDLRLRDGIGRSRSGKPIAAGYSDVENSVAINLQDVQGPFSAPQIIDSPLLSDQDREHALRIYHTGSKSAVNRLQLSVLKVLCVIKLKGRGGRNDKEPNYDALSRKALVELLTKARQSEGIIDDEGVVIDKSSKRRSAVLGQAALHAIRNDLSTLMLPSHVNPPPKHPGEVKWGKLKASEWKTFCTVNLPMTLTRLWSSKALDSKQYRMLENFLHLVSAVKLANKPVINDDDINLYEYHMKTYLTGFLELYPFIGLSPYQHLALHFPTHLRRFGPTHSWRCFAFERYNGIVQDIPTNNILGQMEQAKFVRFCRIQNLRAQFYTQRLPEELAPVVEYFNRTYGALKVSGIDDFGSEIQVPKMTSRNMNASLSPEHMECFVRWLSRNTVEEQDRMQMLMGLFLIEHSHASRYGQRFEANEGPNSNIIFRSADGNNLAGRITSVFSYRHWKDGKKVDQVLTIVRKFRCLSSSNRDHDALRNLPIAAGFQVYDDLTNDLELIPFTAIVSHFVAQKITGSDMAQSALQVIPLL